MAAAVAPLAHPPIVDLSNYEERKEEITQQLMHAATTSGNEFHIHPLPRQGCTDAVISARHQARSNVPGRLLTRS